MVGFAQHQSELASLGAEVFAASVDALDKASEVAGELNFPIGYGVTKAQADALGAWWDDKRNYIQPAEFVLDDTGKILASSYSAGPIGRMLAGDCVQLVRFVESRKAAARG